MRIVNLNTIDQGGSYKAAKRIHEGLILAGAESSLLLRTKINKDDVGDEVIDTLGKSVVSKAKNVINRLLSYGDVVSDVLGTDVTKIPTVRNADAIIIHWCNSFLGYKQYNELSKLGKPILLVAHDMWPCTGGCHLDDYCEGYTAGCRKCPKLEGSIWSKLYKQQVERNFTSKISAFEGFAYVGVSHWSLDNANKSRIWKDSRKACILNPIDYRVFRRYSETKYDHLRDNFDQRIILYGSVKTFCESNKGGDDFICALKYLDDQNYKVIIFGNNGDRMDDCPYPVEYVGFIADELDMAQLYSFADVFVSTSHQESFCYTVGEALACGTPVAAYAVGGILDQIHHKVNGYLADRGDTKALAEGIEYCLGNKMETVNIHNSLSEIGSRYIEYISAL